MKLRYLIALVLVIGVCCSPIFHVQVSADPKADADSIATEDSDDQGDSVDEILAGHSYHGDAFNEGPRQKSYLMGGTGNVDFPVTCSSKRVQAFINQGVGQLHGFWDLEAERSFRHAASLDEGCAMAYWGAALAAVKNRKRARGFIEKAVKLRDKVTKREQLYIDALKKYLAESSEEKDGKKQSSDTKKRRANAYLRALESISLDFPDDLEAKAFVAHRIWQNAREGIPISSYVSTDALLKDIFEVEPLHPAHHYCIHLWDYRKPDRAVRSAARCGPSAPGIAHMWHMPGHIYSRLRRYEDAVYQQEASARVDHAQLIRYQVMPDEIHNFAHNNEWLIRNLVYVGRVHDALSLAKNMIELPQHPKYNTLKKRGGSAAYGRRRLLQLLREYELHEDAIQLCQSVYLKVDGNATENTKTLRLLGSSAAATGRSDLVDPILVKMKRLIAGREKIEKRLAQEIKDLEARIKTAKAAKKTKQDSGNSKEQLADLESQLKKDRADRSKAKRHKSALEKANSAIEGYRLVHQKQYGDALAKLKEANGEDVSWLGEIEYFAAGDDAEKKSKAIAIVRKQVDRRKNEVIPMARLAYLYFVNGQTDKSKELFDKLRETSYSMDLDVPFFRRLEPLAVKFGFGKNWLKSPVLAADIGFRPSLESLGPMRWSPPTAPQWSLTDIDGKSVSAAEYTGRPYILIFYLGHGCLHCAEQLQAFAPRKADFEDAGMEMIAISLPWTEPQD